MMWKIYSHIDGSKVKRTFSPNESMSYYDTILVWVSSALVHEQKLKQKPNINFKRIILNTEWFEYEMDAFMIVNPNSQ